MKNKEIEELLNMLKKCAREDKATLKLNEIACKTILSYIEQLEKENEKANKYIVFYKDLTEKQNKSLEEFKQENKQLENNRYKAIDYIEEKGRLKYNPDELIDILKGDSDE